MLPKTPFNSNTTLYIPPIHTSSDHLGRDLDFAPPPVVQWDTVSPSRTVLPPASRTCSINTDLAELKVPAHTGHGLDSRSLARALDLVSSSLLLVGGLAACCGALGDVLLAHALQAEAVVLDQLGVGDTQVGGEEAVGEDAGGVHAVELTGFGCGVEDLLLSGGVHGEIVDGFVRCHFVAVLPAGAGGLGHHVHDCARVWLGETFALGLDVSFAESKKQFVKNPNVVEHYSERLACVCIVTMCFVL